MEKGLKNVSFTILLLKMCIIFGQETVAQKGIVIDVGHGGKDSGAIGINEVKEKDVVLSIALEMLRLNDHLEQPLEIYLTRYSDTFISLSDRTKLAKALKADLFVSLHCNHAKDPDARGIEVYVSKVTSQFARDAIWMAFELQAAFKERLGFESRGVKFGDFQVLRDNSKATILLELGFLSQKDEAIYLNKEESQYAIALVILQSIIKFLGL